MSSLGEEAKDWIISIVVAIVLAFVIREFVVELYIVDGPSMRPTLQSQERLVVNKFIYNFREPQKGEILVFQYPRDTRRDFIKRVIATREIRLRSRTAACSSTTSCSTRIIFSRRPRVTIRSRPSRKERFLSWVITATTLRTAVLLMSDLYRLI